MKLPDGLEAMPIVVLIRGSQRLVPPNSGISSLKIADSQVLLRTTESATLAVGPGNQRFHKPSRSFRCSLKCENHWSAYRGRSLSLSSPQGFRESPYPQGLSVVKTQDSPTRLTRFQLGRSTSAKATLFVHGLPHRSPWMRSHDYSS